MTTILDYPIDTISTFHMFSPMNWKLENFGGEPLNKFQGVISFKPFFPKIHLQLHLLDIWFWPCFLRHLKGRNATWRGAFRHEDTGLKALTSEFPRTSVFGHGVLGAFLGPSCWESFRILCIMIATIYNIFTHWLGEFPLTSSISWSFSRKKNSQQTKQLNLWPSSRDQRRFVQPLVG